MNIKAIKINKPEAVNFILAQSHFIKTVEDVYEALVESVPGIKFGLAFCEASGTKKIRSAGTDNELISLAVSNAKKVKSGHALLIFLKNAFPINVLNRLKNISEIAHIFCATANPVEILVCETSQGRGIIGVVDGTASEEVETERDVKTRKDFLRTIGYKL